MECRIEHANITVKSIDEGVRFLTTAFPDFKVRGERRSPKKSWLHVGTDRTYLALEETPGTGSQRKHGDPGINHVGFVVDDLEALTASLVAAGYDTGDLAEDIDYRKRTYIFDGNGVEWEFVQYLTDVPENANTYDV